MSNYTKGMHDCGDIANECNHVWVLFERILSTYNYILYYYCETVLEQWYCEILYKQSPRDRKTFLQFWGWFFFCHPDLKKYIVLNTARPRLFAHSNLISQTETHVLRADEQMSKTIISTRSSLSQQYYVCVIYTVQRCNYCCNYPCVLKSRKT